MGIIVSLHSRPNSPS